MTSKPWRFLTPLDGASADDRRLIELTRSDELHLVTQMVAFARVSLLYAHSGNGKTSLINAGVVPVCQDQGYAVLRTRPRPPWSQHDPLLAFRECVLRDLPAALVSVRDSHLAAALTDTAGDVVIENPSQMPGLVERLETLRPSPSEAVDPLRHHTGERLVVFLDRVAELVGRERRLLVVCDQFEELFVHYGNTEVLQSFVAELGEVWASDSLSLHLLFSLREDWVGSMIAFRRAIPEIFANYFRLAPITSRRAEHVLTLPFCQGEGFSAAAREQILADLAACYVESDAPDRGHGERSCQAAEAFVELPALQIVASRMWETREGQEAPLSLVHYESLAAERGASAGGSAASRLQAPVPLASPRVKGSESPPAENAPVPSPSQFVLDHYLLDAVRMARTTDADKEASEAEVQLRLDCLYLLTDSERHRRAAGLERIERELRQIRPSALALPAEDEDAIRRALEPLVVAGLVRHLEGNEYELAHDFAVRAVIHEWRRLDRERTQELGRLSQERQRKERRLKELEGSRRLLLGLLQVVFLLGVGNLIWAAALGSQDRLHLLFAQSYRPGPLILAGGLFCVTSILGQVLRKRRAMFLGLAGLAVAISAAALVGRFEGAGGLAVRSEIYAKADFARGELSRVRTQPGSQQFMALLNDANAGLAQLSTSLLSPAPPLQTFGLDAVAARTVAYPQLGELGRSLLAIADILRLNDLRHKQLLWLLGFATVVLLAVNATATLALLGEILALARSGLRASRIPAWKWAAFLLLLCAGIIPISLLQERQDRPSAPLEGSCKGILGRPLRVGITSWPGYAGGIVANNGFRPDKDSIYYSKYNLCVEFLLMEDVDARAKAFARGGRDGVDIVWSSVDFWANELPGFLKNGISARVIMQVDWSQGGDAIVADSSIRRIEDLYQKRISLALFTPSQWLLEFSLQNSLLDKSKQAEIVRDLVGKNASPDARADFVAGKVDAAVVWEPDVTAALMKRPNSHILVSSREARKLIADLMVAREDFLHEHPDVIQAFVSGWLVDGTTAAARHPDTMVRLLMESEPLYKDLGPEITLRNLMTVRLANLADNIEMFNLDNKDLQPLFDRLYAAAGIAWLERGYIAAFIRPADAKDDSFVRRLYSSLGTNRTALAFPQSPAAETLQVLVSKPTDVWFRQSSYELDAVAMSRLDKEVSLLPATFSSAYIRVEGNTDNSGNSFRDRELSRMRAQAVVDYLVTRYDYPRNQFIVVGNGSDRPIAPNNTAQNRAKNRRIDIAVAVRRPVD